MKTQLMTLAIMVVLAGCRALPGPDAGGGSTDEVLGDWELASGTHGGAAAPILDSHRITLSLREGEVSGTAACNHYGGAAEITGTSITFSDIAQTEMGCEPEVMESEAAYLEALLATDTVGLEGEQLILSGPATELRFTRQVPVPAAELVDTEWVLDTLISGEAASSTVGEPATLTLASDGTLSGSTGCRVMSGRYVIQGDEVQVREMMMSANPCEAGVTEQDGHVVSVVGGHFTVQVDGDRLTLTSSRGDGLGLSYTAAVDG